MVIYTDEVSYEYIKTQRSEHNTKIHVMKLTDFKVVQYVEYWEYCKSIDRETYHTPELYMIWAEKVFFLEKTLKENPFKSTYFFWTDIGCIRDLNTLPDVLTFPYDEMVLKEIPKDKFVMSYIKAFDKNYTIGSDRIPDVLRNIDGKSSDKLVGVQGGFFGGTKLMCQRWITMYEEELKLFIRTGTFGGTDQNIFNSICIKDLKSRSSFLYLREAVDYVSVKGVIKSVNIWFSFLNWLSRKR